MLAVIAIAASAWQLSRASDGVDIAVIDIDGTPATVFRPQSGERTPVVVIAHGFAGSQPLMRSFALTFARNGLTAITFDFLGHGLNPAPLSGDLGSVDGATRALVAQTRAVIAYARTIGDGRIALLGHSMASDIVVRTADAEPVVAATVAVSMFSPAVTATIPRNLLVVVGDWEPGLKEEAVRAAGLAIAPKALVPGMTYGAFVDGTARRVVFAPNVEHASVLFSTTSLRESVAWIDAAFDRHPTNPLTIVDRGPWIALLIVALIALVRPLSRFLPVVSDPPAGLGLQWRVLWKALAVAAIGTPLLLRVLPTHFLPVLVADYLVVHFAVFGLLLALSARWLAGTWETLHLSSRLFAASVLLMLMTTATLAPAINAELLSFRPTASRLPLIVVMFAGTLLFFAALEWCTRGMRTPRFGYATGELAFVLSLALAIALDFERLFFLIIIVPAIVVFFVMTGLFSRWSWQATRHPLVAALANALLFALAIAVTFPMIAG